jgi:hypothetical protein|tara:strand:+ start:50 stop:172 length:123 start_codon:yes stop_codon:yes gene_type:complete
MILGDFFCSGCLKEVSRIGNDPALSGFFVTFVIKANNLEN